MSNFVQAKAGGGSASSIAVAFTSNNTLGNSIVAIGCNESTNTGTMTDSQGNTYNLINKFTLTGGINVISVWLATGIKAGANTVTYNPGAAFASLCIAEYPASIPFQATPLDQQTSASAQTSLSFSQGPLTTTVANELLLAGAASGTSTQTPTAGAGWEIVASNSGSGDSLWFEDQLVSSTGAYTATATVTTSNYQAFFLTLKLVPPPSPVAQKVLHYNMAGHKTVQETWQTANRASSNEQTIIGYDPQTFVRLNNT